MKYIAALDIPIYGHAYGAGQVVDTENWTKAQLMQQLALGVICPSQTGATVVEQNIIFKGPNVTTGVDADGNLVVTVRAPYIGESEPEEPHVVGALWLNQTANQIQEWDGSAWVDWTTV